MEADETVRQAEELLEAALAASVLTAAAVAQMRQRMQERRLRPDVCVKACESRLGYRVSHPQEPEPESEHPTMKWQPPVEDVVRESLRCLVVETEQRVEKGPAYFEPAECYQRRPGKPACQHGAACRQQSGWHWFQYDHPSHHGLIVAPPAEFSPLATWRLAGVPPCRHYTKTGRCLFADSCRFHHFPRCPPVPASGGLPWDVAAGPTATTTAVVRTSRQRRVGRQPRKKRSAYGPTAHFRRFLVDTFGVPTLQGGGGVLDIAGGAGTLSYELLHLNDVQSTIFDPRRPCFKRAQKTVAHRRRQSEMQRGEGASTLRRYDNALSSNDASATYSRVGTPRPTSEVCADEALAATTHVVVQEITSNEATRCTGKSESFPAWAQIWFGRWLWDVPDGAPPGSAPKNLFSKDIKEVDNWDHTRNRRSDKRKTKTVEVQQQQQQQQETAEEEVESEGLEEGERSDRKKQSVVDDTSPVELQPLSAEGVSRALAECSVIVGLHPDGATDAIVDFALEHDKPFALLPCCVYRKHFPERRTPSGGSVKTYEELLDYLQARGDGIQRATLGFEGRNVVLYRF